MLYQLFFKYQHFSTKARLYETSLELTLGIFDIYKIGVGYSEEETEEVGSPSCLWFEGDIEYIVLEGIECTEGDWVLLMMFFCVDKVDSPWIDDEC